MYAVIGQVEIKSGHEEEAHSMLRERGVPMLRGMEGSVRGYLARAHARERTQHSFWHFATEDHARLAEATLKTLRDMSDAPGTFVSVDVCEVVGEA